MRENPVLRIVLVAILVTTVSACAAEDHGVAEVGALYNEYRLAWLRNDETVPDAVVSLFAEDGTLMPHHGDPMVNGRDAIASHWFPDGQVFGTVDEFTQDVSKVEVSGGLGYVYGRFSLTFTFNGQTRSAEGNQLMVARKEGREWKIVALIWNDPPA